MASFSNKVHPPSGPGFFHLIAKALDRIKSNTIPENYNEKNCIFEIPVFSMKRQPDGSYVNDLSNGQQMVCRTEEKALKHAELIGETMFKIFENSTNYLEQAPSTVSMEIRQHNDSSGNIEVYFCFSLQGA